MVYGKTAKMLYRVGGILFIKLIIHFDPCEKWSSNTNKYHDFIHGVEKYLYLPLLLTLINWVINW